VLLPTRGTIKLAVHVVGNALRVRPRRVPRRSRRLHLRVKLCTYMPRDRNVMLPAAFGSTAERREATARYRSGAPPSGAKVGMKRLALVANRLHALGGPAAARCGGARLARSPQVIIADERDLRDRTTRARHFLRLLLEIHSDPTYTGKPRGAHDPGLSLSHGRASSRALSDNAAALGDINTPQRARQDSDGRGSEAMSPTGPTQRAHPSAPARR